MVFDTEPQRCAMLTQARERCYQEENRVLLWHGSRLTNWAGILSSARCRHDLAVTQSHEKFHTWLLRLSLPIISLDHSSRILGEPGLTAKAVWGLGFADCTPRGADDWLHVRQSNLTSTSGFAAQDHRRLTWHVRRHGLAVHLCSASPRVSSGPRATCSNRTSHPQSTPRLDLVSKQIYLGGSLERGPA
eukprot:1576584-Rhodomonas_salina.2